MKTLSVIKPIEHDPRYAEMSKDPAWIEVMNINEGTYYFEEVCAALCPIFGIYWSYFWNQIKIKSRKRDIIELKQIAYAAMRVLNVNIPHGKFKNFSYPKLAQIINDDRVTILHGVRNIHGIMQFCPETRDKYHFAIEKLRTLC